MTAPQGPAIQPAKQRAKQAQRPPPGLPGPDEEQCLLSTTVHSIVKVPAPGHRGQEGRRGSRAVHFPFPSSGQDPRSPASPWAGRDVSGNPGARASYLSHSPTLPCTPPPPPEPALHLPHCFPEAESSEAPLPASPLPYLGSAPLSARMSG